MLDPDLGSSACRSPPRLDHRPLWLLRFGLAQLEASREHADDWIWLIDHSVQIGKTKVLVIVAIRSMDLPMPERPLCAEDLVLIDLVPMETSTRQEVARCLEDATTHTGVPHAIVDDHGATSTVVCRSSSRAIRRPWRSTTSNIKAACLLKARLEKNPRWTAFCTQVGQTRCAIQQTELGALTPPGPKPKARFMNLASQLDWADKVLGLLDGL